MEDRAWKYLCSECGLWGEFSKERGDIDCPNCDGVFDLVDWPVVAAEENVTMKASNKIQVGGDHYLTQKIQHWDFVAANDLDYFQGQITKYVTRWKKKNGMQDLEKAKHFLEKYIEIEKAKLADGNPA
jgi:hypothetical protein